MIFIITILVALLLLAVQAVRETAKRTQCANNVTQQIKAVHHYCITNYATFPELSRTNRMASTSFQHVLLPFLEQSEIYSATLEHCRRTGYPLVRVFYETYAVGRIAAYNCPSDAYALGIAEHPHYAAEKYTSYGANYLLFGHNREDELIHGWCDESRHWKSFYTLETIPDGAANTLGLSEMRAMDWTRPAMNHPDLSAAMFAHIIPTNHKSWLIPILAGIKSRRKPSHLPPPMTACSAPARTTTDSSTWPSWTEACTPWH